MTSLPLLKLLYTLAILAVSLLGLGWAARWNRGAGRGQGLANAFAAGIFLGTGLLHFAVEAQRSWEAVGSAYPWAGLLALSAFMALLFVEHVALSDAAHSMVHAHSLGAHEHHRQEAFSAAKTGKGLGVLLALSLHSFLAGLALGVAHDLTRVSLAATGILAHKLTEGFALGTVLGTDLPARRARLAGWGFAVATPIGILLGAVALSPMAKSGGVFAAVFSSLAAGTFLYIGAFDLLQDEFVRPGGRVAKWILACLGVVVSALLATTI